MSVWATWVFVLIFMPVYPTDVQIFQSGPQWRLCQATLPPGRPRSSQANSFGLGKKLRRQRNKLRQVDLDENNCLFRDCAA